MLWSYSSLLTGRSILRIEQYHETRPNHENRLKKKSGRRRTRQEDAEALIFDRRGGKSAGDSLTFDFPSLQGNESKTAERAAAGAEVGSEARAEVGAKVVMS